ncbi:MAG: glycosyltransferase family 4 protein [Bacteroidetes bacterium]|nr:glycosyltransferase family 4 protein [Bacteroidota bacterium]
MINRIIFVSFQGIRNGIPQGMNKMIMPLFEECSYTNSTLIVGNIFGKRASFIHNNIKPNGNGGFNFLITIISVFNRLFLKKKSYVLRFYSEVLFDLIFSLHINQPSIIISSAYLFYSQKRNKKKGGINILISGNPDDRDINALLLKEQQIHQVMFEDAYMFEQRLNFISKSIDHFDHIVTFSSVTFNSFSNRIPKIRLSKINYHITPNTRIFEFKSEEKKNKLVFCFISNPFWLKGFYYLLEAWSTVNSGYAELVIGGSINVDLQEIINARFADLKNVKYLGWVNDINMFYRSAHIAIIPSLLDAGPTTVSEAMYCGVPVIVSDGCGSSELVRNGENGFIVPSGNSSAIASKIRWFLSNPQRVKEMGDNAAKSIMKIMKSNQNQQLVNHVFGVVKELQK